MRSNLVGVNQPYGDRIDNGDSNATPDEPHDAVQRAQFGSNRAADVDGVADPTVPGVPDQTLRYNETTNPTDHAITQWRRPETRAASTATRI